MAKINKLNYFPSAYNLTSTTSALAPEEIIFGALWGFFWVF